GMRRASIREHCRDRVHAIAWRSTIRYRLCQSTPAWPAPAANARAFVTVIDFAAFIDKLATVSGDTILPFFRTSIGIDNKMSIGFDPVTEADRAADVAMRRLINTSFPQHGIVGEEFGNERPDAESVLVLDPIDGPKAFISGLPLWGTLIALLHNGMPAFGMMHQPYMRERFFGDGGGANFRSSNDSRQLS